MRVIRAEVMGLCFGVRDALGVIEAIGCGSIVELDDVTITGGTLATEHGGLIEVTCGTSTFDDLAIARDSLTGLDEHQISFAQIGGRHFLRGAEAIVAGQTSSHSGGTGLAQGISLGFTASLGHGFGEVGEDHGEPEPDGHGEHEDGLKSQLRARKSRGGLGEE